MGSTLPTVRLPRLRRLPEPDSSFEHLIPPSPSAQYMHSQMSDSDEHMHNRTFKTSLHGRMARQRFNPVPEFIYSVGGLFGHS